MNPGHQYDHVFINGNISTSSNHFRLKNIKFTSNPTKTSDDNNVDDPVSDNTPTKSGSSTVKGRSRKFFTPLEKIDLLRGINTFNNQINMWSKIMNCEELCFKTARNGGTDTKRTNINLKDLTRTLQQTGMIIYDESHQLFYLKDTPILSCDKVRTGDSQGNGDTGLSATRSDTTTPPQIASFHVTPRRKPRNRDRLFISDTFRKKDHKTPTEETETHMTSNFDFVDTLAQTSSVPSPNVTTDMIIIEDPPKIVRVRKTYLPVNLEIKDVETHSRLRALLQPQFQDRAELYLRILYKIPTTFDCPIERATWCFFNTNYIKEQHKRMNEAWSDLFFTLLDLQLIEVQDKKVIRKFE